MPNSITFYKVPFSYTSNEHPYFNDNISRDNYFSAKFPLQVEIEKPNINFIENLEVQVRVPLDFVVVIDYNYAIIKYNNKDFYCYIIDCAHISINKTAVYLTRDIASQYPAFFSVYMKDFRLTRATFSSMDYNKNCEFVLPDFVRNERVISRNYTPNNANGDYEFIPCYVAFASTEGESPAKNWGIYKPKYSYRAYGLLICPITDKAIYYWETEFPKDPDAFAVMSISSFFNAVSRASPYLYSLYITYLPFRIRNNDLILNVKGRTVSFPASGIPVDGILSTTYGTDRYEIIDYLSIEFSYSVEPTYKIDFYIFSPYNKVEVDPFPFGNGGNSFLKVKLVFPLDIEECIYVFSVEGTLNSRQGGTPNVYVLNGSSDVNYTISAQQDFLAQNRYYNDLTKISVNEANWRNINRTVENFSTGGLQIALGASVSGTSNIARGMVQISDAVNESEYISKSRELLKKTEFSKPSEVINGNMPYLGNISDIGFSIIEKQPASFEENNFYQQINLTGVDCNISMAVFDVNKFLRNNKFYIKGISLQSAPMQPIEYTVLQKMLLNGVVWEYYT